MADIKGSQFTTQSPTDITNLYMLGIDLTKPAGQQDRKISVGGMLAPYMLASSGAGGAGEYVSSALGLTISVGSYVDHVLYTPQVNTNDVAMVSLEFGQNSIIPQSYGFQVYAGVPSGSGVLIYDSILETGASIKTATAFCNSTIYVPAAAGNNTLYIRITNTGISALGISFQGVFLEFPGNGVALPTYVPPAPYTGALMSTVHVGASEQFTQPIFGLQALADGGTMILDDGHYYLPIGLLNTADSNVTTYGYSFASNNYNVYGYTPNNPANRFTGGVTIKSASNNPYNCVWDGLGGIGNGFRLAQGKGIVLSHVPITIQGINFISGGGGDQTGDGEAGVYFESFISAGTATVKNCAFDNCENGMLTPPVDTSNTVQGGGPGANVSVVLDTCDFGLNAGNGITPDGLSHNFYNECTAITVTNCHMYSSAVGNTQKCRGPNYTGVNSYIEGGQGRALDLPEGGTATFSNCILNVAPSANAPFLDYNSESTQKPWRQNSFTNPTLNNCTVIGTRNPYSQIFVNTSNIAFAFTNTTQKWVIPGGGNTPGFIPERVQSGYINDNTAATGLFLDSTQGGTILSSPYPRPNSIAQPGATPTPFVAWNGTRTYIY